MYSSQNLENLDSKFSSPVSFHSFQKLIFCRIDRRLRWYASGSVVSPSLSLPSASCSCTPLRCDCSSGRQDYRRIAQNSAFGAPRPKGRPRGPRAPTAHRIVSSLDPLHISAADWITVPSALEFLLRFTRSSVKYKSTFGYNPPLRNIPFPKGLSGFLYYYVPPDPSPMRALLQSGIRLRLAAEPDPESFATSTDLLDHIGFPWHTPVWAFACPGGATFPDVLSHLHAEGLLSTEQLEQVRVSVDGAYFPPHHTLTLFNRGQEFPIRFEESTLKGVHVMCDDDGILRPLRVAQAPLYVSPWMQTAAPIAPWQGQCAQRRNTSTHFTPSQASPVRASSAPPTPRTAPPGTASCASASPR
ncbi:hypothetical protein C8F04DRAFT_1167289 [Mycena alexandri]|uniref:Uncharacterized protein n=1 Tax=Mycena alexandri TaxID=1745969 RepID=A0AAD6RVH9_9AGAR|nr:hypothetical protein C8F04DRAFT_1167289 [Mycena alexandri]